MLSYEENELLTHVGPGTPMGNLLRRFWIPAILSSELPRPDCDPVRVRILGENYVAFRDTSGRVGFLDECCPHRGASLALGRCEEGGLRCIYHGWKFAIDGTILETPNLRDNAIFKTKVKALAFPCEEAAEIVWVYLGPVDKQPPLPNYPFMNAAPAHFAPNRITLDTNWVQVMEGHHDSSHAGILHSDYSPFRAGIRPELVQLLRGGADFTSDDNAPRIEIEDTEFGFHEGSVRRTQVDGKEMGYARVHAHVMPFLNLVPPMGHAFEVPIDDHHTSLVGVTYDPLHTVDRGARLTAVEDQRYYESNHFLGTPENRWLQDRSTMDTSFSGIGDFAAEDWAVTNSMGPIIDRTKEHLVPTDVAVIRLRRLLLGAARDLEEGIEPPVLHADLSTVQSGDGLIELGTPWQQLVPGNKPSLDRSQRHERV